MPTLATDHGAHSAAADFHDGVASSGGTIDARHDLFTFGDVHDGHATASDASSANWTEAVEVQVDHSGAANSGGWMQQVLIDQHDSHGAATTAHPMADNASAGHSADAAAHAAHSAHDKIEW